MKAIIGYKRYDTEAKGSVCVYLDDRSGEVINSHLYRTAKGNWFVWRGSIEPLTEEEAYNWLATRLGNKDYAADRQELTAILEQYFGHLLEDA